LLRYYAVVDIVKRVMATKVMWHHVYQLLNLSQ